MFQISAKSGMLKHLRYYFRAFINHVIEAEYVFLLR
jgi:hypothetical protein